MTSIILILSHLKSLLHLNSYFCLIPFFIIALLFTMLIGITKINPLFSIHLGPLTLQNTRYYYRKCFFCFQHRNSL